MSQKRSAFFELRYDEATQKVWPIAVKRTAGFDMKALQLRARKQDPIETMLVSAYLQGLEDAVGTIERMRRQRFESSYEEER